MNQYLHPKISYSILGMLFVICAYYYIHEQALMKSMSELDNTFVSVSNTHAQNTASTSSTDRRVPPTEPNVPAASGKVVTFAGTLEKVDTGCFADGECFVVVDGKHVTTIMGWSQETVGSVQGVEGFGDLESYIGERVEVSAYQKEDGTFTLYGNEGFYVKLLSQKIGPPTVLPNQTSGCIIGGCSSQLCVDASRGDVVSTCEYREEYACYQTAKCERQASGQCGWTETQELKQCLLTKGSTNPQLQVQ